MRKNHGDTESRREQGEEERTGKWESEGAGERGSGKGSGKERE